MRLKIGLKLTRKYSYNFNLPKRSNKRIKFIIIHYTGMKSESRAIKKLCDPKSKVSSHYYIRKNGNVINLVPDLYEAWHAGKSDWKKFTSLNKYSIGIEITNPGHNYGYKNFSEKQIKSLKKLLFYLMNKYKIQKRDILGHSDISPDRKKDPGEKFPWQILAKSKLCLWHNLNQRRIKKLRMLKLSKLKERQFFKNLKKIGYVINKKIKNNLQHKLLTKAFQRRFRQELVNGKIDQECLSISENLLFS